MRAKDAVMDPEETTGESPGMPEGRTGAFQSGLSQAGQRFQSQVPQGFIQHSVLQQSMPSMNGMSPTDYERIMPGMNQGGRPYILPSKNGTSSNNWDKTTWMRFAGRNVI